MKILGLDPGFSGALAIIDSSTMEIVEKIVMPILEVKKKKSRKVRKTDEEYGKQKTKTYTGTHKMINLHILSNLIKEANEKYGIYKAYLEQVHSRPSEGISSAFRFGQGYGNLEAFLVAHGVMFEYVTPQAWTKKMHKGVAGSVDAKGKSLIISNRLYPKENFVIQGCKKPHDGLIDAVLIARYGAEVENEK